MQVYRALRRLLSLRKLNKDFSNRLCLRLPNKTKCVLFKKNTFHHLNIPDGAYIHGKCNKWDGVGLLHIICTIIALLSLLHSQIPLTQMAIFLSPLMTPLKKTKLAVWYTLYSYNNTSYITTTVWPNGLYAVFFMEGQTSLTLWSIINWSCIFFCTMAAENVSMEVRCYHSSW